MKSFGKILLLVLMAMPLFLVAQSKKERKGEFYFSWGYNKEWYTNSNVKVSQPSLNNDYQLKGIKSNDNPGCCLLYTSDAADD